eukprot:scaffold31631_cov60-Phaeocystis_antarctica.AAC.7
MEISISSERLEAELGHLDGGLRVLAGAELAVAHGGHRPRVARHVLAAELLHPRLEQEGHLLREAHLVRVRVRVRVHVGLTWASLPYVMRCVCVHRM